MLETGISWPGTIAGRAEADGFAAAARAGACAAPDHDSMSRLITRPPGPLPATEDNGILRSAAMFLASGLALTRSSPRGSAAGGDSGGADAGARGVCRGG